MAASAWPSRSVRINLYSFIKVILISSVYLRGEWGQFPCPHNNYRCLKPWYRLVLLVPHRRRLRGAPLAQPPAPHPGSTRQHRCCRRAVPPHRCSRGREGFVSDVILTAEVILGAVSEPFMNSCTSPIGKIVSDAPTLTTSPGQTGCCAGCFPLPAPPKQKLQEHSTIWGNEAQIFAKPHQLQGQMRCYLIVKLLFPTLTWKQLGAAHTTRLAGSYGMELLQGERIRGALLGYNSSFVGKWLEGRLENQPLQPSRSGCALAGGKRAKNAMGCIRHVIVAGAGEQQAVKSHCFWKRLFPAALRGSATGPPLRPRSQHFPMRRYLPPSPSRTPRYLACGAGGMYGARGDVRCWVGCIASHPGMLFQGCSYVMEMCPPNPEQSSGGEGGHAPIRITHRPQLSYSCTYIIPAVRWL